jgi:branched-chain amino acid transport system permease protein
LSVFLESVLGGLLAGGPYALVGIGFALAHGVTGVVQLAHGELVTLGAFAAALALSLLHLDPTLSTLVAAPVLFAVGALAHRLALARLQGAPPGAALLATGGLALALAGLITLAQGAGAPAPALEARPPLVVLGAAVARPLALAFAVALAVAAAVHAFLRRTELGRALRATAQDPEAAQLLGVDPRLAGTVAVGLAAALAGVAGALLASSRPVTPASGTAFTARALVVLLLARPGSVGSGLAAGLLVGLAEGVATAAGGEALGELTPYALLLALLLLRPARVSSGEVRAW